MNIRSASAEKINDLARDYAYRAGVTMDQIVAVIHPVDTRLVDMMDPDETSATQIPVWVDKECPRYNLYLFTKTELRAVHPEAKPIGVSGE